MPFSRRCMVSSSRFTRVRCRFRSRIFPSCMRMTGLPHSRRRIRMDCSETAARMSSSPRMTRIGTRPDSRGNGAVLHGDGCQIGQQHGHNEFRRLHLADLPLAHQADGHDEQQI